MKRSICAIVIVFFVAACSSQKSVEPGQEVQEQKAAPQGQTAGKPAAAKPAKAGAPKVFDAPPAVGTRATCPIMGNEFVVTEESDRSEYNGKHVGFSCGGCKPQFDANPGKYL